MTHTLKSIFQEWLKLTASLLVAVCLGCLAIWLYGYGVTPLPQTTITRFQFMYTCCCLVLAALSQARLWASDGVGVMFGWIGERVGGERTIMTNEAEGVLDAPDWASPALEPPYLKEEKPRLVKYKLADMLYYIVTRHYDNRPISRQAMERLGFEQRYWNLAHAVLVAIGIRDRKRHAYWNGGPSSGQALRRIGQRVRIGDFGVECLQENGDWRRLNLRECHFA